MVDFIRMIEMQNSCQQLNHSNQIQNLVWLDHKLNLEIRYDFRACLKFAAHLKYNIWRTVYKEAVLYTNSCSGRDPMLT